MTNTLVTRPATGGAEDLRAAIGANTTTPASFPQFEATTRHIELIDQKTARLAQARTDSLAQLFTSVRNDYNAGLLNRYDLLHLYEGLRDRVGVGLPPAWDAAGIPISAGWIITRLTRWDEYARNGPDGLSWVGVFPLAPGDPAPFADEPVVYVLYDAANEPVYVGSTSRFRRRLRDHWKDGKRFVAWMAVPCVDRERAYELEEALLRQRMPRLNKRATR